MSLESAWPSSPPPWLLSWAVWHLQGANLNRPVAPPMIPTWAWEFRRWARWRLSGGLPGNRPTTIPDKIPLWAWAVIKDIKSSLSEGSIRGLEILQRPTLYLSWGLENGQYTPESLCLRARMLGFTALAVQSTDYNILNFPRIQSCAYDVNMKAGIWEWGTTVESAIQSVEAAGAPDFLDINIEHSGDWPSFFGALRMEFKFLPMATSTNFWGFINHENQTTFDGAARPVVALGVACRPEAYLAEAKTLTPERVSYTASRLGWPYEMILPLVSLYSGPNGRYGLADYDLSPYAGWGAYTAEYL